MSITAQPTITKRHYLAGVQCHKLVWHLLNDPDAVSGPDPALQDRLRQGTEVGALARKLYPNGVQITGVSTIEALSQTEAALTLRRPIFEAAFEAGGCFVRTDILVPVDGEAWELVEVKSSTSVADVHLDDLAFQAHVLGEAGVPIRRYSLLLVDNSYVRCGEIDPHALFTSHEVTGEIQARMPAVGSRLKGVLQATGMPAPPTVQIGSHCGAPYPCPLQERCWSFLPEHNVTEFYRVGAKAFDLLDRGVTQIAHIPGDVELTERQRIQFQAVVSGDLHVDPQALQGFLARLEWPIHLLDFETFSTAIPLIDGVRPYQQVPFQSSLHIWQSADGQPDHHSFLAEDRGDPRPDLLRHLGDHVEERGSIVVYNQQFEEGRLRECAEAFPKYVEWVEGIIPRMVDLLEPFQDFRVYHRDQRGSCSIKLVLPALTGQDYGGLAIQDGTAASREFLRVTWGECDSVERERVRRDLLAYCGLDTVGMVAIISALRRMCGS